MRIGVDLDGVQYQFDEDARHVVANHTDVPFDSLEPARVWNFYLEQWGVPHEDFWDMWFRDVRDGLAWRRLPPVPGSVEGLTLLRDAGHTIHIVTSRKGGENATTEWIQTHDVPYDTITIGRDKTVVNFDLLVDDWEKNWQEVTAAGGRCLLWNQPWNSHVEGAERVHDWTEVLKIVEGQ